MVKTGRKIQREASKAVQSLCSSEGKKKYKGVRMRSWGSWVSEIRAPNQKTRIWLGSYSSAEAAARAYDAALVCLKGSKASLNFPLSASSQHIPQDTVLSPKSIQRVAAAAANSFVDNASTPPSPSPPSISISTSSSPVSSPSISSSPSDQIDDDVSLISAFGENEPMAMMESWYNFVGLQSPKYIDQMFSGALFDIDNIHTTHSHLLDDLYEEESDIRLWSFC